MLILLPLLCLVPSMPTSIANQASFGSESQPTGAWRVDLSTSWDVLGPFPIQAREQQFLSPSFPLNLTDPEPIDYAKSWPSAYADGGRVSWTNATASEKGELEISFPDIRWTNLRATEGWAALQHHAVLHTQLTVYPPSLDSAVHGTGTTPHLLVNLIQGSYFTIIPTVSTTTTRPKDSEAPHWYAGNIYDMERGLPQVVPLPAAAGVGSGSGPTTYDVYVSGDFEIRLFGDPQARGGSVPVQTISISVEIEGNGKPFVREESLDVVPDFVGGYAFGEALGVALRSVRGSTVVASVEALTEGISLKLLRETSIVAGQTRIVPIQIISQDRPFRGETIDITLQLKASSSNLARVTISLPVKHLPLWTPESYHPILATYFYATSMPTAFVVIPPKVESTDPPKPAILATHGAGVDIIGMPFWADSLARNTHSWIVSPTGRTSWGLDWHGPSAKDAWSTLDALYSILDGQETLNAWKIQKDTPAVLMGHSNGGQGAWYLGCRYPDRVVAVVPAAAYLKSQAYVPLSMSRSAHFTDPALLGILESSLTPDNNDLFLTNLVDTPLLAIHGGDDENVPVWHTRQYVDILKQWNPDANVTYREDAGGGHWYPSILKNPHVEAFLNRVLTDYPGSEERHELAKTFTLTVSVPAEVGSMYGWRVQALAVPGRLGRLTVQRASGNDGHVRIKTSNLERLSVDTNVFPVDKLVIDETPIHLGEDDDGVIYFEAVNPKMWKVIDQSVQSIIQPSGRMQAVLSGDGPIVLVIPDATHERELSVALRIAHDLQLYHRLDAEIIHSSDAANDLISQGNVVVIGNEATFGGMLKAESLLPQQALDGPGIGLVFLHSHPSNAAGNMVMLQSTDHEGLEKAARLFPIRTGIAVPDWLIVGPLADTQGMGGVLGAGVWGNDWGYSSEMSWSG